MEPASASTVYCTRQPVEHVLALPPPHLPLARELRLERVAVNGEIYICITAQMFQFSITVCFPTSPPIYSTIVRLFSGIQRHSAVVAVFLSFVQKSGASTIINTLIYQIHRGRKIHQGCLRIGCRGRYLGLRGTREQGNGEDYITRSLVIYTPHQILFD
jgi:hypothetical protein